MAADTTALELTEFAALFHSLNAASGIVLAVSGGVDSTVLMHLSAAWLGSGTLPALTVATVDHGLRENSAAEAAGVARSAATLGLRHVTLVWRGDKPKSGLQEAAREARYALLTDLARAIGASHLVTAHTLDDQAETILLRMARGSGPIGLIGMRPLVMRGGIAHARPLLGVPKARLVAAARVNNWPHNDDPSNVDPRFARSRLRQLLPLLAAEGLTAERFATLARRMARIDDALVANASHVRAATRVEVTARCEVYNVDELARQPMDILCRVLGVALQDLAGATDMVRLERLESLAEGLQLAHQTGRRFKRTLAGTIVAIAPGDRLVLSREGPRGRRPSI